MAITMESIKARRQKLEKDAGSRKSGETLAMRGSTADKGVNRQVAPTGTLSAPLAKTAGNGVSMENIKARRATLEQNTRAKALQQYTERHSSDMGEVDAFLEKIEAMLRRRDLETENLQHKLEELDGAREAQTEKLSILNGQVLLAQEENQRLTAKIDELQKELEEKEAWIETLEGSLTSTRTNLAAAQSETLAAESRAKTLENAAQKQNHREELQKRLTNAGSAAMDSLKQMSRSIKSLKKK